VTVDDNGKETFVTGGALDRIQKVPIFCLENFLTSGKALESCFSLYMCFCVWGYKAVGYFSTNLNAFLNFCSRISKILLLAYYYKLL
jgi:hypothetical protein